MDRMVVQVHQWTEWSCRYMVSPATVKTSVQAQFATLLLPDRTRPWCIAVPFPPTCLLRCAVRQNPASAPECSSHDYDNEPCDEGDGPVVDTTPCTGGTCTKALCCTQGERARYRHGCAWLLELGAFCSHSADDGEEARPGNPEFARADTDKKRVEETPQVNL